jgi:hypothetical protein
MRTRRTRKIRGGVGLSDFTNFFTGKSAQGATGPESAPSEVDQKVNEILGLTGYHMRAIINAISVCNSTMKMQNNAAGVGNSVLNAFGSGDEAKLEMTKCGSQCIARSETVKDALKKLLEVAGETPVLGYIASGTGAMNSANYVGNSTVSLGNKASAAANQAAQTASAAANQASQAASNAANQAAQTASNAANQASQAASRAASSVGDFFSGLTRKATQPQVNGGRRRRTRRR